MNNFLSIVNNFNLVIYTDENSFKFIDTKNNPNIKIIIKPFEEFYNYKYKNFWIQNHEKNYLLREKVNWEVNMLWSEKIWFVKETIEQKYYDTEFYGWCDIGYFRNSWGTTHTSNLINWPNNAKILQLNKDKIYYACVLNDDIHLSYLNTLVNNKNHLGLPFEPIPSNQNSIAGGFFVIHPNKIDWWSQTYDNKLELYFENNYLVKDDQIIILDCVMTDMSNFVLVRENHPQLDNWFLFQRYLNHL
jgi:hypothetical protein